MSAKKVAMITLAALIFLPAVAAAQGQSPLQQPLADFDKLVSGLKVGAVVGQPIAVGETTIIPFAKITFGLGGGGAMMAYGGGMGGKAIPLGILIIEGESVRAELFPEEEKKPSFLQEMLPTLLQMLPQMMGGKMPGAPKPQAGAGKAEKSPTAAPAGASLAEVKKLFEKKDYAEALTMVDALLAADPKNADLHAWKGHIMGSLAQDNPADMMKYGMGAMREYETALELDPNHPEAHFGRAVGRLMAPPGFGGDLDGAIEDLEFAVSKQPSAESYYYLGEAYKKKGLTDKARAAYQKALKMRPDYPEAVKALAEIK